WRWLEATVRGFRNDASERRLAIVVRDVTERQENRLELERRLELESRIADFSRVLLECGAAEVEAGIEQGLGLAGQLAGADRAFLVTGLGEDGARPRSYDWAAAGVARRARPFGLSDRSRQEWVREQLARGEVVRIERVEDMPAEADAVRASLLEGGVRSYLAFPILSDECLAGVLGFHCLREERRWSAHDLNILRLVADLFTSALRRRGAESTLRDNQMRLLQAQKMEAIGTLAGGIAHDFNNQLTVMLANARFVKSELPAELAEAALALDDVTRAAEHCAQLTRSLLAFSRRSSVSTRALDASEELAKALELLRPLVPSSIRFDAAAEPDLGWVVADSTQLQQVLVNLVVNARDAMRGGRGTLSLRAARRHLEPQEADRIGLLKGGSYLEFQVRDDGPGMDPEVRARIFEPFFTTKPVGQGTGLGLATAYGIVQQAHGVITVDSEPGRGSTFCVYLPEAMEHEARDLATAEEEEEGGSGTVLLAEDEQSVRRITARMLRAGGYEVLQAEDGGEALRLGRQNAGRLTAIVTDLEMPEIDGLEVARRLARERPELPVVFISGTAPEGAAGDAFDGPVRNGCFVPKPFTGPQLLAALRELLARVDD
ncbi:MAG: ATP-binding protein, partial [Myxococcota bacterium]|nr:ATP-binding protein [Myxococcota bacterium]